MNLLGWKLFYTQVSHLWLVLGKKLIAHKAKLACDIWLSSKPWPSPLPTHPLPRRYLAAYLAEARSATHSVSALSPLCQVVTHALQ